MTARTSLHQWVDTVKNILHPEKKKKHPSLRLEIVASPVDPLLAARFERDQSLKKPFNLRQKQLQTRLNGKCAVQSLVFPMKYMGSRPIGHQTMTKIRDLKNGFHRWNMVKPCTAWHLEWISMTSLQIVGYRCLPCTAQLLQPGQIGQDWAWQDTQAWTVWGVLSLEKQTDSLGTW